jgi:hypothetical protein
VGITIYPHNPPSAWGYTPLGGGPSPRIPPYYRTKRQFGGDNTIDDAKKIFGKNLSFFRYLLKTKKMAKRIVRLTESDLERIVSKVIEEQSVLGTMANIGEIGIELAKSVVNVLPMNAVANLVSTAVRGDAKSFTQALDQEKARLGQNYQSLKNALTQGDVAKNLSNIGSFLSQASQPYISQMKSGLGNKPATAAQNPANYGLVNKPAINKPATKKPVAPVQGKTTKAVKPVTQSIDMGQGGI